MEIWYFFDRWGEYHHKLPIIEKNVVPNVCKAISMLDSLIKNFSRKTSSFEFMFLWQFSIMIET